MRLAGTPVPRRDLTVSHFADTPVVGLRHLVTGETAHLDGGTSAATNTRPLLAQKAAAPVLTWADQLKRGWMILGSNQGPPRCESDPPGRRTVPGLAGYGLSCRDYPLLLPGAAGRWWRLDPQVDSQNPLAWQCSRR